jgi:hypothetical protein
MPPAPAGWLPTPHGPGSPGSRGGGRAGWRPARSSCVAAPPLGDLASSPFGVLHGQCDLTVCCRCGCARAVHPARPGGAAWCSLGSGSDGIGSVAGRCWHGGFWLLEHHGLTSGVPRATCGSPAGRVHSGGGGEVVLQPGAQASSRLRVTHSSCVFVLLVATLSARVTRLPPRGATACARTPTSG